MSVLESISARLGEEVSGSDIKTGGHDKKNISGKDLVVYSGAIPENNEELSYARKLGVPVMERSEFLAFISSKYRRVIAVAGCHGKTTTTAMLGEVLAKKIPQCISAANTISVSRRKTTISLPKLASTGAAFFI